MLSATLPAHIRRRWDAIAFTQLCEAASLQAAEMDRLRSDIAAADALVDKTRAELHQVEDDAEFWREQANLSCVLHQAPTDASILSRFHLRRCAILRTSLDMQLQLCERTGGKPGITQTGALVVVDHPHVADAYDAEQVSP